MNRVFFEKEQFICDANEIMNRFNIECNEETLKSIYALYRYPTALSIAQKQSTYEAALVLDKLLKERMTREQLLETESHTLIVVLLLIKHWPMTIEDAFYSTAEVCEIFGFTRQYLMKERNRGAITGLYLAGAFVFSKNELARFALYRNQDIETKLADYLKRG